MKFISNKRKEGKLTGASPSSNTNNSAANPRELRSQINNTHSPGRDSGHDKNDEVKQSSNDDDDDNDDVVEVKDSSKNERNAEVKQSSVAARGEYPRSENKNDKKKSAEKDSVSSHESSEGVHPDYGTQLSSKNYMHMFKIQKIVDPVFDQDAQPELWISWKHKIEVYCRSFGKHYVDVLKSKERVNKKNVNDNVISMSTTKMSDGLWCKCETKSDQKLMTIKKSQSIICVSCGDTLQGGKLEDVVKKMGGGVRGEDHELSIQRNAQIHGLLIANLSNTTFAKYCYSVDNGDGAELWKLLCDNNEMYTQKLSMAIRQAIF